MQEFLSLFPERTAEWLIQRGRKTLIVTPGRDGTILQLRGSGQHPGSYVRHSDDLSSAIDRYLSSHSLKRKTVEVGLRLSRDAFFERSVTLPREVTHSRADALLQDLKARTPFRPDDIYCGHGGGKPVGENKILVHQWIIRKDIVADAVSQLSLKLDDIVFVEPDGNSAPFGRIALRSERDKARPFWARAGMWVLVVSMPLLAAASAASTYWRQQLQMDELAVQIAAARAQAQKVRAETDSLERRQGAMFRLRQMRTANPTLLEAWNEASRILPPHSWLTELRVTEISSNSEQQMTMTGFSAAASTLVGVISQSPMFFDASLTAPIAMDPIESRERFTLQAKIRQSKPGGKAP
jgi:general secretion pathway protein L